MDALLIVLAAVAVLALAVLIFRRAGQKRHDAKLERQRIGRRVEGHKEEAQLHIAKATRLEEQAVRSRELAAAHEERAGAAQRELDDS